MIGITNVYELNAEIEKGKVKEIYPYDAMMLNTSITVDLIKKELL